MLRASLCLVVGLAIGAGGLLAADKDTKSDKGQTHKATITKMDAKNGTITVRMKDKNGKDVPRTFKLTEDIRYFDSTGRVAAVDVFQSGNDVLIVEEQGRLKEVRQSKGGNKNKPEGKNPNTEAKPPEKKPKDK